MGELNDDINDIVNKVKHDVDVLKIHRHYIYVIVAIVTLAVCLLLFNKCENQKHINDLVKNISNYSDSAKHYKTKYGQIAFNQTLKFDNEKQLKSYFLKNDTIQDLLKKFKKLSLVTIVKEKIFIHDTISIPYESVIPCDFTPFKVKRDTNWYHFTGTIYPTKFTIDTILIPNKQSIVFGVKKMGLFKCNEERVEIKNSNPFITVDNIGGYTIDRKKKWFQRPAVTLGVGALIGGVTALYLKK